MIDIYTQRSKYDEIWLCFSCNMKWSGWHWMSESERAMQTFLAQTQRWIKYTIFEMVTTILSANVTTTTTAMGFVYYIMFCAIWHTTEPNTEEILSRCNQQTHRENECGKCLRFSQKHTISVCICWTRFGYALPVRNNSAYKTDSPRHQARQKETGERERATTKKTYYYIYQKFCAQASYSIHVLVYRVKTYTHTCVHHYDFSFGS